MKILKYIGLTTLIISYTLLISTLTFDTSESSNINLFSIAWAVGISSLISNAVYAIKAEIKDWIFSIFGFCGLIWFPLPLVSESFGIVSLTIFLIIGIYIHIQPNNKTKKTA